MSENGRLENSGGSANDRSPGQLAWRRFLRDTAGVVSGGVVLFFFLVGLGAPLISLLYRKNPGADRPGLLSDTGIPLKPNGGIDSEFWFGLEPKLGRDVLMRLVYGIRTSLLIALVVVAIVTTLGTVIGIAAGYLGGKADYFIGRIRCWKAKDVCAEQEPPLVQLAQTVEGHLTACHFPESRHVVPDAG